MGLVNQVNHAPGEYGEGPGDRCSRAQHLNGHFDREHHDDPLEFWGYTIVSFSLGCLRYARACQRVPVPADVYRWLDFLQLTTRSDDQLNSVCWAQNIPFTLYESSDRPFISS